MTLEQNRRLAFVLILAAGCLGGPAWMAWSIWVSEVEAMRDLGHSPPPEICSIPPQISTPPAQPPADLLVAEVHVPKETPEPTVQPKRPSVREVARSLLAALKRARPHEVLEPERLTEPPEPEDP
jgi:hypothetical protein